MSDPFTAAVHSTNCSPGRLVTGGVASGLLANILLWETGLANAGFAVWLALFINIAFVLLCDEILRDRQSQNELLREAGKRRSRIVAIGSAVALSAALLLVLRSTPLLMPLMWLVMMSAAAMVLMQLGGVTLRDSQVRDFMMALLKLPVLALVCFPPLVRRIDYPRISSNTQVQGTVRGILIALPLLLIFTLLFASADAGFSRLLPDANWFFSSFMPARLALIIVVTWIATGLLQGVCSHTTLTPPQRGSCWQLGAVETTVVMGLLSILFVLFVILQLGYLFGGTETILATTGLTLADYARRGFFELLAVAGLTLVVLLVLGSTSDIRRPHRILAAVLVLCVLIILASAAQRLYLYMDAYGLTLDRMVAAAFMVWLASCLLLFSATVLRGRTAGFAAGIALSGIAMVLLLALANPAGLVTAINIDRAVAYRTQDLAGVGDDSASMGFSGTRQIDIGYLLALGSDAVPVLLSRLENLDIAEQCEIARNLLQEWTPRARSADSPDWRSWNASQARARRAVRDMTPQLQEKVSVFTGAIETAIPNLPFNACSAEQEFPDQ